MLRCAVAFRTAAVLTLLMIQSVLGGETFISIVPIGTGPNGELAAGAVINGNTITLTTDGINPVPVFLEFRIGDWDPADTGVTLAGYQPAFDSASFTTGASGALTFNVGSTSCGECSDNAEPCYAAEDCTGGTCSVSGGPCHVTFPDCPSGESCLGAASCDPMANASDVCAAELGTGSLCGPPGYFLGSGTCSFAYTDANRPDFVLANAGAVLPALDVSSADVRPAYAVVFGPPDDPEPFPAEGLYGATLALLVPPDAQGTFTISLKPFPLSSLSSGTGLRMEGACSGTGELCYTGGIDCPSVDDICDGQSCVPSGSLCRFDCPVGETCEGDVEMISAQIRVNPGRCCYNLQFLPFGRDRCDNGLTENECAAQPGVTFFETGGTCKDDCPAVCGDNIRNQLKEECDGTDADACPGLCLDNCLCGFCGDDIQTGTEACDGADDAACPDLCLGDCSCAPFCGDNVVNQPSEECDGADDAACVGICLGDCTCNPTCGDVDGDGDADMLGVAIFMNCFTGPDAGPVTPECQCAEFDTDDDIDLDDLLGFLNTLNGP